MRSLHLFGWLPGIVAVCVATPNVAQPLCKPAVTVTEANISEVRNRQRTWVGVLRLDASPCASASGEFEIEFTRLKENAPDLRFVERFTWASGQTKVSLDISWDEWVQDYRLSRIAPCPCRK
jgi:hypothetical protein